MKTVIAYVSLHHGSTKKLADAIADKYAVALIDAAAQPDADLSRYDRIGFASGVAYGRFYRQMNAFIEKRLPAGKQVFFLYTCGRNDKDFSAPMKAVAQETGCAVVGAYGCSGFDTYGPLKLIGGLNKGHPDAREIQGALDFYEGLQTNE